MTEHVWTVDNITDAGPWQEFYKVASTRMRRIDGPFRVLTSEGEVQCEDGWLALDSRGYPYPIAVDEQAAIYRAAIEVDDERMRTTFTEKVAAQLAARRAAEALLSFTNYVNSVMSELTPLLNAAMTAHPDPASAQAQGAIEQVDRLAKFFLDEHPELISGGAPVDAAINAIATLAGSPGTPIMEMVRAVGDNLVIHSTQTGRLGWAVPSESLRQQRFRYLAQDGARPWSEVESRAAVDALNTGLVVIDHTRVMLTNGGRAALGLVPLGAPDQDRLAEPGKLG